MQRSKRLQTNLPLQLWQLLPLICQFDNGDLQVKLQSHRKKEETILTLKIGLKRHISHYQYFFCWVFTLFKCKYFWFLLCRKVFHVVTFGFSLANGCEKSTFFIWTRSFTVKKSVGSGRSSKAHFLFQPVTRNRWARLRHSHFKNMKDVGEIFQTATQAGSVPTSHNCHQFPVRCAHLYL